MILGFAASEVSGRFDAHSRKVLDTDYAALIAIIRAGLATYAGDGLVPPQKFI
jgi:hypothetical protein